MKGSQKKAGDKVKGGPKTPELVESHLLKVETQQVHTFIDTRKQALEKEIVELRKKLELDGAAGNGDGLK